MASVSLAGKTNMSAWTDEGSFMCLLNMKVGRLHSIVEPPGMTKPSPSKLRPPSLYGLLERVIRTVASPSVTLRTVAVRRECRVRSTGVRK